MGLQRRALLGLLFLGATPGIVFAQSVDLAPVLAKAMEGSKVPAMGILVIRDGKVASEAVRGVRRNDGADPVTLGDVWHIGSDGKAMTATLIARLVDRGVLSWSKPLDQMLPELAASMNPQYRSVTLVGLLSHHSGLPHDIADVNALHAVFTDKTPASPRQRRYDYVSRALQDAPVAPTTTSSYSNTGPIIASVIAERVTGSSFEDLIRKEVFIPLGMRRVGFGATHSGQNMGHAAGKPTTTEVIPDLFAPAGNMYMPLGDWALFCIDQINGANGGGKLLKPETYRLMQRAQPGGSPVGLGWAVEDEAGGRRGPALAHSGSDGNWYAIVVLFPSAGSGVLVAANAGESMGGDVADKAAIQGVVDTLSPPAP